MSAPARGSRRESLRRSRLIAAREFRERVTQRAFRLTLLIGSLVAVAAVILPAMIGGDDGPADAQRVAVVVQGTPAQSAARLAALRVAAQEVRGAPLAFVPVSSEAELRRTVRDSDEPLGLLVGGSAEAPRAVILSREGGGGALADQVAQAIDIAGAQARAAAQDAGGRSGSLFAPATVGQVTVAGGGPTVAATAVVSALGLLLYLAGIGLTTSYANGIVSDRTNHVTERLLTAARPFEHLAGKLVGVGAAGLIQFAAWLLVAVIANAVAGSGAALDEVPTVLIIDFPVALILTYVLYAATASVLVLPVRKSEDVSGAIAPAIMLQVIAFIAATTIVAPGATVSDTIKVMSLIPFFSPMLMLGRLAGGDVAGWEVAVAVIGPLVTAALLLRAAAPAYARYAIETPGGKGLKAALQLLRS